MISWYHCHSNIKLLWVQINQFKMKLMVNWSWIPCVGPTSWRTAQFHIDWFDFTSSSITIHDWYGNGGHIYILYIIQWGGQCFTFFSRKLLCLQLFICSRYIILVVNSNIWWLLIVVSQSNAQYATHATQMHTQRSWVSLAPHNQHTTIWTKLKANNASY